MCYTVDMAQQATHTWQDRPVVLDPVPDDLVLFTVTFLDTGERVYWTRADVKALIPV